MQAQIYNSSKYFLLSVTMRMSNGFRKLTVIDLLRQWRRRYGGRNISPGAMADFTSVATAQVYPGTSVILLM